MRELRVRVYRELTPREREVLTRQLEHEAARVIAAWEKADATKGQT